MSPINASWSVRVALVCEATSTPPAARIAPVCSRSIRNSCSALTTSQSCRVFWRTQGGADDQVQTYGHGLQAGFAWSGIKRNVVRGSRITIYSE
eukprot:5773346-Prymnesium_polylepis.2